MANKVKNVRPGILVVPDAGLRLAPGAVVEVKAFTPQLDAALKSGWLVNIEPTNSLPLFDGQPASDHQEEIDISKLSALEAITKVGEEKDPDRLKTILATEKRRSVIDALKKRLAEVEGGAG